MSGLDPGPPRRLALLFHDIAAPRPGLMAPDEDHVARLLAFAATWSGERPLLVSCALGISRSTAAAYAIACTLRPQADENDVAQQLRRASPWATPNPLIVALSDRFLGRQGRMSAAIAQIGRGADYVPQAGFVLRLR